MAVQNKIRQVHDDVCKLTCAQFYEGECRAYQMPHSEAERVCRNSGSAACERGLIMYGLTHEGLKRQQGSQEVE